MKAKNRNIILILSIGMIIGSMAYNLKFWNDSETRNLVSKNLMGFGNYNVGQNRNYQKVFGGYLVGGAIEYIEFVIYIKIINGSDPIEIYLTADEVMFNETYSNWFELDHRSWLCDETVYKEESYSTLEFPDDARECSGGISYSFIFTSQSVLLINFDVYIEVITHNNLSGYYFTQIAFCLIMGIIGIIAIIFIDFKETEKSIRIEPTIKGIICNACGIGVKDPDTRFCPSCGHSLQ